MKLLIKNSNVVFKDSVKKKDLLIENGIIHKIEDNLNLKEDCKTINAQNLFCMPGLIDLHVHLREPGNEEKETIKTASKAAAAGGVTSLACMANTNPVTDTFEKIESLNLKIKEEKIKIYPIAAITKNLKGKELVNFKELALHKAYGFSDDGFFVKDSALMASALKIANELNLPIFSHCEDFFLANSTEFEKTNNAVEAVAVSRDAALCFCLKCPVHICHVSTKESVEIIRAFKKIGAKITAQTCPHYFTLTKKETLKEDANFKMNPPLREEKDVLAIEEALKDGTLDCIATDHAPHEKKAKENFKTALNGVIGLETSLCCTLTHFYKTKKMSLPEISKLLSLNPAKILKIKNTGEIKKGNVADLVLVNTEKEWKVEEKNLFSKSKNSPFLGKTLKTKVTHTISSGEIIYENN